jgi:hypothetical protein
MLEHLTFAGNPPLFPKLDIPCYRSGMVPGMAEKIAQIVMAEKPGILATTPPPPGEFGDAKNLTGRFMYYNLLDFDHEELRYMRSFIAEQYTKYMTEIGHPISGPCYIRAWANAFEHNNHLVWHNHFEALATGDGAPIWSHVSGMACIQTFGTRTWFLSPFLGGVGHDSFGLGYNYPADCRGVENIVGDCFFFPSWVVHRTEPNNNPTQPRITVAYDIITEEIYQAKKNAQLFSRLI